MRDQVCFDKTSFNTYIVILFLIVCYLFVYIKNSNETFSETKLYDNLNNSTLVKKIKELNEQLFDCKISNQECNRNLQAIQQTTPNSRFLDKIFNPLAPPENVYPGGNMYSRGYDGYQDYQMIGYISNSSGQYPMYGRYKYPGKTDRYEYYTINEGRNRIKIPVSVKNNNELYSGDTVIVSELGPTEFTFNKYENEGTRYNPNVF